MVRLVVASLLIASMAGCSGSRVSGRFLGLDRREACVPDDDLAHYSASRSGHVLHIKCAVDRGVGEPVVVELSLWWDYGFEASSVVWASADPREERRSSFSTESVVRQEFEHEAQLRVLDLDREWVRGSAHAWSERSDFHFDFAGSVDEWSEAAE